MALQIKYLNHSGFVVDTGKHILIFDYFDPVAVEQAYGTLPAMADFLTQTDLKAGDLTQFPSYFLERKVVVFCSHAHADHYSPEIFRWKRQHPEITYVLSDDITPPEEALLVSPEQTYEQDGMIIKTLRSTDAGVAFAVEADGYRVYHAGDLHWWHWEGQDPELLHQMRVNYCTQIDRLKTPGAKPFTVAFLPLDPRLGEAYAEGLVYFLQILPVQWVMPMHFWGDFDVIARLMEEPRMAAYRDSVVKLTHPGETVSLS